jgi:2-oxoglutarate dehydrogenase E1 component
MATHSKPLPAALPASERELIFDRFRRWGYLEAGLDPLGIQSPPQEVPELDLSGPDAESARSIYCGTIGWEFMHIPDAGRREWLRERVEGPAPEPDRERILELLIRAEIFEQVLQSRYIGTKRYSLEGLSSLVPLLHAMLESSAEHGAVQVVLAMAHRGRLNVMTHAVGKPAVDVFAGFEDFDPRSVLGGGDVKYHLGATGQFRSRSGKTVNVHLVSNPSHLEAVNPVALGRVRAKQTRAGKNGHDQFLPIELHGDAAFAGQGIVAETLNFSGTPGFNVGGTVHVITNNLIGFTTNPREDYSSHFSSDVAKRLPVPIFHVNAEDPEAVVRVGRLALEYRYRFHSDVVVDLIGYRRHGHSEVDDPTITQPRLYARIKDFPVTWQNYAARLGVDAGERVARIHQEIDAAQQEASKRQKRPQLYTLPSYWDAYQGGRWRAEYEVATGISAEDVKFYAGRIAEYPADFHIHPKVKKLLEQRRQMGEGKLAFDYGAAEAIAFASLVAKGTPIRCSGQDARRATFNQRHAVLIDVENEQEHVPLAHVAQGQARFEIYNSALSEAAVLGFEYGFSRDYPEALVLWEAQFGDFANSAQIIIDQFVVAGEDKWGLKSGLVLLLPHGYEGQGPEHSSARIERYLQLAAKDNIVICQPSTAAQYFHLLRRQALRPWRKPLIVFTPKGMLRHPLAASRVAEFTRERFLNVRPDETVDGATRILVCTGKIGHELAAERKKRNDTSTAIVFVEQLFPFPEQELSAAFARHPRATEIVWVQEEPANQGALFYMLPRLRRIAGERPVRSVKRTASASPATGSHKAHEMEQRTLIQLAFA